MRVHKNESARRKSGHVDLEEVIYVQVLGIECREKGVVFLHFTNYLGVVL